MASVWRIPIAIVIAGAMVAWAAYFALRPVPSDRAAPEAVAPARPSARGPLAPEPIDRERRRAFEDEPATASPNEPVAPPPARDPGTPERREDRLGAAPPLIGLPAVPDELTERVQTQASAAFDAVRERVRRECWEGLPADPDAPSSVELVLSLSLSAEGAVLASGIAEDRAGSRAGLAGCLGPIVHALQLPAPHSPLSIEVPVRVP